MRILFVGAGGIGGYFGGKLVRGGCDITFLVREGRRAQLAAAGLGVRSPLGDFQVPVQTQTRESVDPNFDLIVLSCKAFDLASVMDDLADKRSPDTFILPLLNGLAHYEALDARFGAKQVLGGLCHINVTLSSSGEVVHRAPLEFFAFGPRDSSQKEFCQKLAGVLERGGFAPKLSADIEQDAWEKFAMLSAYAGATCLMQASVGEIVRSPFGGDFMLAIFAECCEVAKAHGRAPRDVFVQQTIATLTDRESQGTASMLRDMRSEGRVEADHIVGDMLRRAKAFNIPSPLLQTAYTRLKCYELQRG
jgi:2-dehydropantoate 2-reductase